MLECCTCDTVESKTKDDVSSPFSSMPNGSGYFDELQINNGVVSMADGSSCSNEEDGIDVAAAGDRRSSAAYSFVHRTSTGTPIVDSLDEVEHDPSVRPHRSRMSRRTSSFGSSRSRRNDSIAALQTQISSFMEERSAKRLASYLSMVKRAAQFLIACVLLATVSEVLRCIDLVTVLETIGRIMRPISILALDISLVLLGACPTSLLDVDKLLSLNSSVRIFFGASLALLGCVKAFFTYPHASFATVPFALMLVIGNRLGTMPSCTSLIIFWLLVDQLSASVDDTCDKLLVSNTGEIPCFVKTGRFGFAVSAALQACLCCRLSRSTQGRKSNSHASPTEAVLRISSLYLVSHGLWNFAIGIIQATLGVPLLYVLESFGLAVIWLLPTITIVVVGELRICEFVAHRFDHSREHVVRDGEFIAELLETASVIVEGQYWWVLREAENLGYRAADPRRHWRKGIVLEVTDDDFLVEVPTDRIPSFLSSQGSERSSRWSGQSGVYSRHSSFSSISSIGKINSYLSDTQPPDTYRLALANRNVSIAELIENARNNLVCIDWASMTRELLKSSVCDKSELGLARRLRLGEVIDFFISHSWHDDADLKWDQLEKVVHQYRIRKSRDPTFWLDKVCIDQNNIGDGLRVLPVNVMACRQMIVLCGFTYPQRLWCAWELCTLFALSCDDSAFDRVVFIQMAPDASLQDFDHKNAHCFDPNDETRLTNAIWAVGSKRFNDCVQALAEKCAVGYNVRRLGSLQSFMELL